MITEPNINIEQKYQPARSIGSVHRLFAASNHEHFAHVEMDDRRFVFLRVSDLHMQDTTYFAQLAAAVQDPSQIGQSKVLSKPRQIWGHWLYVAALRLDDGELLIVVTDHAPEAAITDYAKRWAIETLFGCFKTCGYWLLPGV
jgi:hypothetical protein